MSNVHSRIIKTIVKQLGVDESEVKPESTFVDDLGADSLDTVELVMAFEQEVDIKIADEEAEKMTTVQAVFDYIDSLS